MTSYVKSRAKLIEDQRGPRLSAMDDYGNIKKSLERAESVTKDMGKLLKSFWEAAVEEDTAAMYATLQRLHAVSLAAAQNYAWLAAEALRANE
ncbi:MAG: hypothetical protein IIX72_05500 [Oscillospiraceae bacterium]|nr:hypothetical protein [Oscillospiraceae bacterium]